MAIALSTNLTRLIAGFWSARPSVVVAPRDPTWFVRGLSAVIKEWYRTRRNDGNSILLLRKREICWKWIEMFRFFDLGEPKDPICHGDHELAMLMARFSAYKLAVIKWPRSGDEIPRSINRRKEKGREKAVAEGQRSWLTSRRRC